jgi:hypothetical protein
MESIDFDVNDVTANDMRDFEAETGIPFDEMSEHESNIDVIQGIVWLVARRSNPGMTYNDAGNIPVNKTLDRVTNSSLPRAKTKRTPRRA